MGFSSRLDGPGWSRSLPIGSAREESKIHIKIYLLVSGLSNPLQDQFDLSLMLLKSLNLPHNILKMFDLARFAPLLRCVLGAS